MQWTVIVTLLGFPIVGLGREILKTKEILEGEEALDYPKLLTTSLYSYSNNLTDAERAELVRWEIPDNFRNKFPFYLSGYDYEDRAVIVIEYGKWDTTAVAEKGGEDLATLEKIIDQYVERIRTGYYTRKSNNITDPDSSPNEVAVIIDVKGDNVLKRFRSAANTKHFIETLTKLYGGYDQFAYGFLINTNAVMRDLIQITRPWTAKFLEKMDIYGTIPGKWIPHLLRRIPRDQLPPDYGGIKGFKPLAFFG